MPSAAGFLHCWFDTEYSELDLDRARVLQVALVVTDAELRPVGGASVDIPDDLLTKDGFSAVLELPPREEISQHVLDHYQPLLERCEHEGRKAEEIDGFLAIYLDQFPESRAENLRDRPVLSGNSIHADYFLARRYFPRFMDRLSYRLFDVTTFKLEWQAHYREEKFVKLGHPERIREYYPGQDEIRGGKHDAYFDVQASIAELAFYRSRLGLLKDHPK